MALASAVLLAVSASAQAAVVTSGVVNGNFESTATTAGSYCYFGTGPAGHLCSGSLTAWSTSGLVVAIGVNSADWGTPGSMSGASGLGSALIGLQNSAAGVSQTLNLAAGLYTLSWVDAGRSSFAAQDYEVLYGGNVLGSFHTDAGQAWTQHSITFSAITGAALTFASTSASALDRTSFIDNVSVNANAVPEPGTLPVVLAGLAAAALVRRRQRG